MAATVRTLASILGGDGLKIGAQAPRLATPSPRGDELPFSPRTEQDADGQANPFLSSRGQADPAPRHALALLEQGDLSPRADLERVGRVRQAALRGAR